MTALLVPVAGLVIPLISADPAVMAQASATPKPGSAGGNHSKPGDNKKKKKTDNKKKSNNNSNRGGSSASHGSSSASGARRSGSSFSEQTNANNRWSADGANRSVNTRISSQAQPQQPAPAPSQVIHANPSQGQQNSPQGTPQQAVTPPPRDTAPATPPAQTSTPPAAQSTQTAAATPATTPSSPSNPVGPATALVIGATAVAASRRRSSAGAPSAPAPADNWDHGTPLGGPAWDLHVPQSPATHDDSSVVDQVLGRPNSFEISHNETGDAFALPPAGGTWTTSESLSHPTPSEQSFTAVENYMYGEMANNANSAFTQRIRNEMSSGVLSAARGLLEFHDAVQVGGVWDHKPVIQRMLDVSQGAGLYLQQPATDRQVFYDMWSNIHYGFVGKAAGIPSTALELAPQNPLDNAGVTDDGDIITVRAGIDMFEKYGADMTAVEFAQGINDTVDKLQAAFAAGKQISMTFGFK
ncbi:polymorphic toxin type 44 domain-containing protein [Mycolicibacterium sp. Y3]